MSWAWGLCSEVHVALGSLDSAAFSALQCSQVERVLTCFARGHVAPPALCLHEVPHAVAACTGLSIFSPACLQIADFGLSRQATGSSMETETYGTVTHMPPGT